MLPSSRQRDARGSIIAALLTVLGTALLPAGSYVAYALVWLAVAGAGAVVGYAPLSLARRGLIVLPFTLAALPLAFIRSDELIWSGALGSAQITISGAGLRIFFTTAAKAWISAQVGTILVRRYPIESIVGSLRALRLPDAIATGAGLTVRYLELLRGEAARMVRARAARSASPVGERGARVGGSISWRAKVTGNLAGALFLRAYARAGRVEEAAIARGARGSLSLGAQIAPDARIAVKVALALVAFATIAAGGALLPRF